MQNNPRTQLVQLLKEGHSLESVYTLLHEIVHGINPTFFKTITTSPEWVEWEKWAYDYGFDYAESVECGHLSPEHFTAFLNFIRKDAIMKWQKDNLNKDVI